MKQKLLASIFITMFLTLLFIPTEASTEIPQEVVSRKPIIKVAVKKKIPPKLKPVIKIKPKIIISRVIPQKKSEEVNILLSYYSNSNSDCGKTDAISASGKNLNRGSSYIMVAAPSSIPFGTIIDVDGLGLCQVVDRGGAISKVVRNGKIFIKLDIYVPGASQQELMRKGIVKTKGRILK